MFSLCYHLWFSHNNYYDVNELNNYIIITIIVNENNIIQILTLLQ
jgi:hypothetical protein